MLGANEVLRHNFIFSSIILTHTNFSIYEIDRFYISGQTDHEHSVRHNQSRK